MAKQMILPIDDKGFPFEILKNDKLPEDILKRILSKNSDIVDDSMMKGISKEKMGNMKEDNWARFSIYLPDGSLGCFVYGKGGFAILFGIERNYHGIGRRVSANVAVYSYSVMSHYKLAPDNLIRGKEFNMDDAGNLSSEDKKEAKNNIAKEEEVYSHKVYQFVRQAQMNGM